MGLGPQKTSSESPLLDAPGVESGYHTAKAGDGLKDIDDPFWGSGVMILLSKISGFTRFVSLRAGPIGSTMRALRKHAAGYGAPATVVMQHQIKLY